jgi:hypothetical protein
VSTYWRTLETLSAVRAEVLDASGPENQEALEAAFDLICNAYEACNQEEATV